MAKGYIPVNRDQQFLFPPDMREWLGKDHFVWWLLDVVARLDTKELHKLRRRGAQGRTGYDPDMMLALLLYAYTHKVRSSREIERLCQTDVAFRVICAGNAPDHSTIARFRQDQAALCEKLFAQVLELCALAGLAQVGVVALDGTKVAANASKGANYGRAQLEAQRAKLEAGIQEMFAQAQAADNDEDERFGPKRGDELPAGLAGATARRAALDKALAALAEHEARQRPGKPQVWARAGRYEQALPAARAAWAAHQATKCPTGRLPRYPQGQQVARIEAKLARAQAKAEAASRAAANRAQVNRTDPDSRLMPIPGGWPGLQRPGRGQLHRHHPGRRRVLRPQRHGPVPAHGGRPGPGGAGHRASGGGAGRRRLLFGGQPGRPRARAPYRRQKRPPHPSRPGHHLWPRPPRP